MVILHIRINNSNNIFLCFWVTYEKTEKFNHLYRSCIDTWRHLYEKLIFICTFQRVSKMTSTKLKSPDFTPAQDRNAMFLYNFII